MKLTGVIAWLMWLAVHLFYITGFKNQVTALLHWLVTFVSNERSERVSTEQQVFGRLAIQRVEGGTAQFVSPPSRSPSREELEARAVEEARLTDAGERGRSRD